MSIFEEILLWGKEKMTCGMKLIHARAIIAKTFFQAIIFLFQIPNEIHISHTPKKIDASNIIQDKFPAEKIIVATAKLQNPDIANIKANFFINFRSEFYFFLKN